MSTRWYPLFQAGNPQLRVFLPNFWMKVVKPEIRLPLNMVQFHISPEMTEYDVKNYLKKIYNLPVVHVRTEILMGSLGVVEDNGLSKKDDIRLAHVTLRRDTTFTFPNVTGEEERGKELTELQESHREIQKYGKDEKLSSGTPTWFT